MIRQVLRGASFVLALAACVTAALASDKYVVHDDKSMDDTRKPAPGKALVYFVRTQMVGAAISVQLVADKKPLGWTRSRTFVVYEGDPGKHEFVSISEGGALLDAELPGSTTSSSRSIWVRSGRAATSRSSGPAPRPGRSS
jgi:hypothetical protein